jgi:hypothetical protein
MALPESGLGRSRFQRDESGDRSRNSVSAGSVRVVTRGIGLRWAVDGEFPTYIALKPARPARLGRPNPLSGGAFCVR